MIQFFQKKSLVVKCIQLAVSAVPFFENTQAVWDLSRRALIKFSKLGGIAHVVHYAMKYSQEVGKNLCLCK